MLARQWAVIQAVSDEQQRNGSLQSTGSEELQARHAALEAQAGLAVVPRKSARIVAKTLKSAIANAENNHKVKPETLVVREAVAQTAMRLKRFTPKARGSAGPIIKRYSHIKIVLSDE